MFMAAGSKVQGFWNSEVGMGNADKDMVERLNFIFSAFRIPNSTFIYFCPLT
jgi:hypothetical protein